ncbi:small-conductance mechanosensitive channel MscS [Erwinia tasmaniensis]|uniref:Small-conductance mechanosensitive channel n=1 Tax=Erwinia tasmaniensis (strain DSM 17950 / CFBP 7177 / CIP 109463 / NCPPB 4357 / Et1/99) TaxID=465817 RepID=B2VF21_ERWT9|nr:small-conductance mechanosensitive channel MscS [Erwinia tasmaniensis]CAO97858.1 Small-conductance mechanosensitive channel [Erwinia tasmaniensis Et1/99]
MDNLNVVDGINSAGSWLVRNQALLIGYVVNIVAAIVIMTVGMVAARFIAKTANRLLVARHIDPTVADFLSGLVRYGIIAFTLIAALGRVGVETASVIAALAAASLAFAMALQGSLGNLAAGVLLVTFRPFRAGEFVDLGGVSGTVLQVQIFSSTLRSTDGKIIVVPNGKIIGGNIINYSREPERRNEFIIGVAYDADIDRVFKVLREVVDAEPRVVQSRGVQIGVNELAGSSVNVIVRCWSKLDDMQNVYWDLMKNFKIALDANKIGIPYPQMDVHFHQNKSAEAAEKPAQQE